MKTCKWQEGYRCCGSYAFNLHRDGIDQGEYCDVHYWQDQAKKATLAERDACIKICESMILQSSTRDEAHSQSQGNGVAIDCANAIRARK